MNDRLGDFTLVYFADRTYVRTEMMIGGFKANLTSSAVTEGNPLFGNLTSTLFISDYDANETQLSCAGSATAVDTLTVCITGIYVINVCP